MLVDGVFELNYLYKSIIKICVFVVLPLLTLNRDFKFLKIEKKHLIYSIFLGVFIFTFILLSYFSIGAYFDFSQVTTRLEEGIGVNKDNFIYVSIYISLVNSFIEEFFFRGIGYMNLKNYLNKRTASLISAGLFSIYHVGMMITWFDWYLFMLLIISLVIAGLMFNYINEKTHSIYTSWMVHLFANLSINTVGMILFGII
jgi:membrane protease YdiL (CAAX protease family)